MQTSCLLLFHCELGLGATMTFDLDQSYESNQNPEGITVYLNDSNGQAIWLEWY